MTRPLIVLAACSILLAVVLTPAWPWFFSYLNGERPTFRLALLVQPMILVSLALVAAGFLLGWSVYRKAEDEDPLAQAQPSLFRILENKFWLDELYDRTAIALARFAARVADWMDRHVWDGFVRFTGALGGFFGTLTKSFDEAGINTGADGLTNRARSFGRALATRHSGQIQNYLGALAIGMLALLLLYAWLT
jgi:NADH-quinone oxidoreductase subunit L